MRLTESGNEIHGNGYLIVVQDMLNANPVMSFNAAPFETSITFGTASAPWFADYQHIAYWFYLLCVVLLSLWLIYSAALAFTNPENVSPVRETRGFSRAQTGDALTAIIPLCWSVTMLMHASTHSNNFDENTDTCSLSLTIIAYQWGWNYYFPEDTIKQLRKVDESETNYNEFIAQTVPSLKRCVTDNDEVTISEQTKITQLPAPLGGRVLDVTASSAILPTTLRSYDSLVNVNRNKLGNLLVTGDVGLYSSDIKSLVSDLISFNWTESRSTVESYCDVLMSQYSSFRSKSMLVGKNAADIHSSNKRLLNKSTSSAAMQTAAGFNKRQPAIVYPPRVNKIVRIVPQLATESKSVTIDFSELLSPFMHLSNTYETSKSSQELVAWNLTVIKLANQLPRSEVGVDAIVLDIDNGLTTVGNIYNLEGFRQVSNGFTQSHKSIRQLLLPALSEDVDQSTWSKDVQLTVSTTRQPNPIGRRDLTNLAAGLVTRMRVNAGVVLPSDVPMHVICGSKDVIHSWAIPGLGIKIDCIPGYNCHRRLMIRWRGLYWGQCMEVCGRYHHWMPILVKVAHVDLFILWLMSQGV